MPRASGRTPPALPATAPAAAERVAVVGAGAAARRGGAPARRRFLVGGPPAGAAAGGGLRTARGGVGGHLRSPVREPVGLRRPRVPAGADRRGLSRGRDHRAGGTERTLAGVRAPGAESPAGGRRSGYPRGAAGRARSRGRLPEPALGKPHPPRGTPDRDPAGRLRRLHRRGGRDPQRHHHRRLLGGPGPHRRRARQRAPADRRTHPPAGPPVVAGVRAAPGLEPPGRGVAVRFRRTAARRRRPRIPDPPGPARERLSQRHRAARRRRPSWPSKTCSATRRPSGCWFRRIRRCGSGPAPAPSGRVCCSASRLS